jgi:hypothetical protein
MNYENPKKYRVSMDATGEKPMQDVAVQVDGRDLPSTERGLFVASIFIDRVMHTLSALFGVHEAEVAKIHERLDAGETVNIEVDALHEQLVQAGFVPN